VSYIQGLRRKRMTEEEVEEEVEED